MFKNNGWFFVCLCMFIFYYVWYVPSYEYVILLQKNKNKLYYINVKIVRATPIFLLFLCMPFGIFREGCVYRCYYLTCVHWWLQLTRLLFRWIHNGFVLVCLFVCFKCQFKNNWLHILFLSCLTDYSTMLFVYVLCFLCCIRSLDFRLCSYWSMSPMNK